jgi:hypothetical protein
MRFPSAWCPCGGEPTRYRRAAARFQARLVQDIARVELADAQIALVASQGLRGPDPGAAAAVLAELFAALELTELQQRLEVGFGRPTQS